MELGEGVVVALMHSEEHNEQTCAFCTASKKPTTEENVLTDAFDEDANLSGLEMDGVKFKNSAGKLGDDMIANGDSHVTGEVTLEGYDKKLPVTTAAHHIIPGNAALKTCKLMPYLHSEGKAQGNIGYNVNNYENGVWLCGNYSLRGKNGLPGWGSEGATFTKDTQGRDPKEFAFAAIEQTRCQFHDGHEKYSNFVKKDLDLLAKKMAKTKDLWCPDAKNKPDKPEERQMFMLVARLNTTSRRLRTMLTNPGKNWKTNIFTSRFSEMYIKEVIYK